MCQFVWETLADLLKDADLSFVGHQNGVKADDAGLIFFTHSCGTTLAIEAEKSIAAFTAERQPAYVHMEGAR